MKVSYNWLQKYIKETLPSPEEIGKLLTTHAFEIEEVVVSDTDATIDVDVLNNRAHDCLSHYGIAKEIALIAGLTFVSPVQPSFFKEVKEKVDSKKIADTGNTSSGTLMETKIEAPMCKRIATVQINGINNTQESPKELVDALAAIGERSINFIVDVTNFVMYELGQPMHAYDTEKLDGDIVVRQAKESETITTLDKKDVVLNPEIAVIADNSGVLGIAGVKGGNKAEVTKETTSIVLEAANFDGVSVRNAVKMTGIRTDSSKRFENEITPRFISGAMSRAIELITKYNIGSTAITKAADIYPKKTKAYRVGVSLSEINSRLGVELDAKQVEDFLIRLELGYSIVQPKDIFIQTIKEAIGKSYKYGASVLNDSPNVFDCSSLVAFAAVNAGISIPRMVVDQYAWGEVVAKDALEVGDLIFSNVAATHGVTIHRDASYESVEFIPGTKFPEGVDHLGVYIGDGELIHATEADNKGVVQENITDSSRFGKAVVGYRRIIKSSEDRYVITIPHERIDLRRKEDIIEEIARLYGYENIADVLCKVDFDAKINPGFYWNTFLKKILVENGFSEVFTYAFVKKGDLEVAKPFAKDKSFLRIDLEKGLSDALTLNDYNADLVGIRDVMIFEIGHVYNNRIETPHLAIAIRKGKGRKKPTASVLLKEVIEKVEAATGVLFEVDIKDQDEIVECDLSMLYTKKIESDKYPVLPEAPLKMRYVSPSPYPFIARDIALWVDGDTSKGAIEKFLRDNAGSLLVKLRLFDEFSKEVDGVMKTSFAYRMVFQSDEKTLSDEEALEIMNIIYDTIARDTMWEVR